jgi:preprotein translocase subunit SecB
MANPAERQDLNELLQAYGGDFKIPPVKMREYVLALAVKAYPLLFPFTEFDLSNLIEKLVIEAAFASLGEQEFQRIMQACLNEAQQTKQGNDGESASAV